MRVRHAGTLAPLLEAFFTERLMRQRLASTHTMAAYRDSFRLFLTWAHRRLRKPPSSIMLEDIDAPLVSAFLDHLERERGNSARTRNARLAAIHSFFQYAALRSPAESASVQRVLAVPAKRIDRAVVDFLAPSEIDALLAAPDARTWIGRRDHAILLVAVQTGLRASELTGLRRQDVIFGSGAHIRCFGKGRKERCTPLTRQAVDVLRRWMHERSAGNLDPLFPTNRGTMMSRDAFEHLVSKHARVAAERCPSIKSKKLSPHVLRHTTAMQLLQSGVDRTVIALWLGHESLETTQGYLAADMAMKERALAKTAPPRIRTGRFKPGDRLLAFLSGL